MKLIDEWSNTVNKLLAGRSIVDARFLTEEECRAMGWEHSGLALSLGTKTIDGAIASPMLLYASNGEGDDAGFVMCSGDVHEHFPIIELGEEDGQK